MELLEFCRKASVRLNNEIDKTLEKCDELYKKIHQVYKKWNLSLATNITDLLDKYQHMEHLKYKLQEDVQHIQKMEVVNKEDVKTLVGKDFVRDHILEDVYRSTLEKVTDVETQLGMHKVTMQMLEPRNYKSIIE